MNTQTIMLILLAGGMLLLIAAATHFSGSGNLDNIKSKTVGDGQHGTARWANRKEIQQTYRHIPFHVSEWRSGKNLPYSIRLRLLYRPSGVRKANRVVGSAAARLLH